MHPCAAVRLNCSQRCANAQSAEGGKPYRKGVGESAVWIRPFLRGPVSLQPRQE